MSRVFAIGVALLSSGCAVVATHPKASPITESVPMNQKSEPQDKTLEKKLDEAAARAFKEGPVLGMQVLVVQDGKLLLDKSYGFSSIDKTKAVDGETRFGIGSITKQLTAGAVLQLVDAGKVRLTDPVSKYIPEMVSPITVAQLLNQTAGLTDYATPLNIGKTRDGITSTIAHSEPAFVPGNKWHYSNSNYYMLGRIIEIASRQTYADYLARHVFAPLGMTASSYCHAGDKNLAVGSAAQDESIGPPESVDYDFYFAAGGICSTSSDLNRWQTGLFGGKVLTTGSLSFMTTAAVPGDGSACNYGAGVVVDTVAKHRRWWHNGALPSGFESQMSFFPDDHLTIIILTNTLHQDPTLVTGKLSRSLARIALGITEDALIDKGVVPTSVLDLPLPADASRRFEGTFSLAGTTAEIVVKDGKVHSLVGGKKDLLLLYQGNDTFLVSVNHAGAYHFVIKEGHTMTIDILIDGVVQGQLTRVNP
jgi:D-alanyl-D-alanine carboxypeptidase